VLQFGTSAARLRMPIFCWGCSLMVDCGLHGGPSASHFWSHYACSSQVGSGLGGLGESSTRTWKGSLRGFMPDSGLWTTWCAFCIVIGLQHSHFFNLRRAVRHAHGPGSYLPDGEFSSFVNKTIWKGSKEGLCFYPINVSLHCT
jgi:hypothetical protein